MGSFTNYLMNLIQKNSFFSIVDQQGNILLKELKIQKITIDEKAVSATQPLNIQSIDIQQQTYVSNTIQSLHDSNENITSNSTKINHDNDVLYSKITNPNILTIKCFCPNITTCNVLLRLFKDKINTYTIASNNVKIKNMIITNLEFSMTKDTLALYPSKITLQEVFFPEKLYDPINDADQDSIRIKPTIYSVKDTIKNMIKKIMVD